MKMIKGNIVKFIIEQIKKYRKIQRRNCLRKLKRKFGQNFTELEVWGDKIL